MCKTFVSDGGMVGRMGNREDLVAGARDCLYDKGYARTTARDIAAAAGVSLAAIGYHFGTKDALLNVALREAIEQWGEDLGRVLAGGAEPGTDPADRFARTWTRVVESFADSARLWAVQFELLAQLERVPELRAAFADSSRAARLALADLFGTPTPDEAAALQVGAFYQALLAGLAAQWLADPTDLPTGADLLTAVRHIARPLRS